MNLEEISKYSKAVEYATVAHKGQIRKISGLPKIVHPYSVSVILLEYGYPVDLAIAGLLHDVVEDCEEYSIKDIENNFGKNVANYVKDVTEPFKSIPWKSRKIEYINHIKNVNDFSKALCAADKIHNLLSIYKDMQKQGINMFNKFNASRSDEIWFYTSVYNALIQDEKREIEIYKTYKRILNIVIEEVAKYE